MTKILVQIQALIDQIPAVKKALVPVATAIVALASLHYGASAATTVEITGILSAIGVWKAKNAAKV